MGLLFGPWKCELYCSSKAATREKETSDQVNDRGFEKYVELGQISWDLKSKTGNNQVWTDAQKTSECASPLASENEMRKHYSQTEPLEGERGWAGEPEQLSLRIQVN